MNEQFISYLWFNRLFYERQTTLSGEPVEVISTGLPNSDAGPDVFNAKVRIGGTLWAGNVEFHTVASDWHRHHHDNDPAYQNIILHVVLDSDEQIFTIDGKPIPTIVLLYPDFIRSNYQDITSRPFGCSSRIPHIDHIIKVSYLETLMVERLESKTGNIESILERTTNNWDEALYVLLARSLGSSVNSDAMQQLALATPLKYLLQHSDSPLTIEAALLGQAGLIDRLPDSYNKELYHREFCFFRNKFSLTTEYINFRFARMRPASFPTMRIIELAHLIPDIPKISELITKDGINRERLLKIQHLQLINCYLPLLYHYSRTYGRDTASEQVIDLMHELPAERNFITRHFQSIGIIARDAANSQALIQLYRTKCERNDCIHCRFAQQIISSNL